jgi:hypothetical protein
MQTNLICSASSVAEIQSRIVAVCQEHPSDWMIRIMVRAAEFGAPCSIGDQVDRIGLAIVPAEEHFSDGSTVDRIEIVVSLLTAGAATNPSLSAGFIAGAIYSNAIVMGEWPWADEEDAYFELWVADVRAPYVRPCKPAATRQWPPFRDVLWSV